MTRIAALAIVCAAAAVAPRGVHARSAIQDPPAPIVLSGTPLTPAEAAAKLTGKWKLNEELSPLPRAGSSAAAGAVPGSDNRGRSGRGPQPRQTQFLAQQQELRLRALSREFTVRPHQLLVSASIAAATFTDEDATERAVQITNKKIQLDLGTALVDAKAYWNGGALTIEIDTGAQPKLFEIFEVAPSGNQMLVTIRADDGGRARSGQLQGRVQRVYDRVDR